MQEQSAKIKEIFTSIQGEGIKMGLKHIFVRFCTCNLNCSYCDTDFKNDIKEINIKKLYEILKKEDAETISFTGGEPLLNSSFLLNFLKEYKTKLNKKIYLETNGTLSKNLKEVINYIDTVAMDIKIKSATKQDNQFEINDEFLKIASKKEVFIKVVFDEKIEDYEIKSIIQLAKKYNVSIILQPKMPINKDINLIKIYDKFYAQYKNVRLIPQVHKFLLIS